MLASPQWHGLSAGEWCAHGLGPDLPADQRLDDGAALIFDTLPLAERMEILGAPVLEVELSSDRPAALLVARLSDVAPDGAATLVSFGALNLTHRDSHEAPEPLEPGRRYRVRLQLNDCAHAFPAGHRLRLALANAYFPMIWPSPEAARLTLWVGASTFALPVRPPRREDEDLPPFAEPEAAPPWRITTLLPGRSQRKVERDPARRITTTTVINDAGRYRIDAIDLEVAQSATQIYEIGDDDPASARVDIAWTMHRARGEWRIRTESRTVMSCTSEAFHIAASLEAFEGERRLFARTWDREIPRDLV